MDPKVVACYAAHLEGEKLKNFLTSVSLYCVTPLKMEPEVIVSVIEESFFGECEGKEEIIDKVVRRQTLAALERKEFELVFKTLLDEKCRSRPMIHEIAYEYLT